MWRKKNQSAKNTEGKTETLSSNKSHIPGSRNFVAFNFTEGEAVIIYSLSQPGKGFLRYKLIMF